MIQETVGLLGVAFVALSWIPQAIQTIKTKKSGINLKFGVSQFIGSSLIIVYAYMVKQPLFIILNIAAAILILINLRYVFEKRK